MSRISLEELRSQYFHAREAKLEPREFQLRMAELYASLDIQDKLEIVSYCPQFAGLRDEEETRKLRNLEKAFQQDKVTRRDFSSAIAHYQLDSKRAEKIFNIADTVFRALHQNITKDQDDMRKNIERVLQPFAYFDFGDRNAQMAANFQKVVSRIQYKIMDFKTGLGANLQYRSDSTRSGFVQKYREEPGQNSKTGWFSRYFPFVELVASRERDSSNARALQCVGNDHLDVQLKKAG